jgi:nucleoside-diphosphate-sugar epimerase
VNIILTGATGFLGSALMVDLARDHRVLGVARRRPSSSLCAAAGGGLWAQADIADAAAVQRVFALARERLGSVDAVLHFAAFYHFGSEWRPEYQRVNVEGTRLLLAAAARAGVARFVFAGSIAALEPGPPGRNLTESSTRCAPVAYARSKFLGEALLRRHAHRLPVVSLRIGGVFSDWCELPPLYSLMRLWAMPRPLGCMIPGRGGAGFPYIHRQDLVQCLRRIVACHGDLPPFEVLFAAPNGCTLQRELFPGFNAALGWRRGRRPIFVPVGLARSYLSVQNLAKRILGRRPYERRWMLAYADRPLVVDARYTHARLAWQPRASHAIEARLPLVAERFRRQRAVWERRNIRRNEGRYEFAAD